jgi:hypothetical protein
MHITANIYYTSILHKMINDLLCNLKYRILHTILYIKFSVILSQDITHISHIMNIGWRFRYEYILHNIRHNIAMVRFADVHCRRLIQSLRAQSRFKEVTLSFQSESRVVTVTIFVPGRDTQVALEPCLQSLRVVSATKGSEHDRHCRAASGSALVRLH